MKEWDQFLSSLEQELGSSIVNRWLRSLTVARFDAGNLYLATQDPMQAVWFEEHIRPRLKEGFFNENHRPIKVHLESIRDTRNLHGRSTVNSILFSSTTLDPECTLAHFIPSPGNLMAYKLIENLDTRFNPVFLYGPKGCGRTHLLMGAALEFSKEKKKVFYVNADTFTDHVVHAIRMGYMSEFRQLYRKIDILLIDDVEQLAGRSATQEEFFHTFNTLHTLGKPILLASTIAPSKLTGIESRLISRFEWGIAISMEKTEMRQILAAKAKLWNFTLCTKLEEFLVAKFPSNPILALQALVLRMQGSPPSLESAERMLADLLKREAERAITPEKIIKTLSEHFGLKPEDITGKAQAREFSFPRQIAMYLCRKKLNLSFQTIGKLFAKDHSTVMSSVKQIQKEIDTQNSAVLAALESTFKIVDQ
jgi:chromosomal replication initiator protein